MVNILYLMPGTGSTAEEKERRQKIANTFLTNDKNVVIVDDLKEGPLSIESCIEGEMSIPGMLRKAIRMKGQYDALIIGCADDPGIFSMRELLDVPVVGPMETSIAMAAVLGEKFSIITIDESVYPETRMILRKYGALDKCASIRSIECTVLDMISGKKNKEEVVDAFVREAQLAVKDGASCITLGCMTMAFLLLDEAVKDKLKTPVINPAKVAVKMAEMLVSLNLRHSQLAYPKPNFNKLSISVLPELAQFIK